LGTREKYLQWLDKSTHVANLKAAIAVQAFVLIMGTMVVTNSKNGFVLMMAVLFAGYQVFCAFLANFKYTLACSLVGIPNLVLAALFLVAFVLDVSVDDPLLVLWLAATTLLGLVAIILSRVSDVPSQAKRALDSPQDDA